MQDKGCIHILGIHHAVVIAAFGSSTFHEPFTLRRNDAVVDILPHPTRIAKIPILVLNSLLNGLVQQVARLRGKFVILLRELQLSNLHELIGTVVRELELIGEASVQSLITAHHRFNLLAVTGKNDNHITILLRHHSQETLYRAVSEILTVTRTVAQRVCLVDEEDITSCFLQDALHVLLGVTDITTNDFAPVDKHYITLGQQAQRAINAPHHLSHSCLTCTRVTGKQHVMTFATLHLESQAATLGTDSQAVESRYYVLLNIVQANHHVKLSDTLFKFAFVVPQYLRGIDITSFNC